MNGFKSGASSDNPFADDSDGTSEGDNVDETTASDESDESDEKPHAQSSPPTDSGTNTASTPANQTTLPWIYARDSITDGRSKTVQLHLQDSTLETQRKTKTAVENELGSSIKKADLREAALLVGMSHIDEVADVLSEWGYDAE
jgi:hypothetical protein